MSSPSDADNVPDAHDDPSEHTAEPFGEASGGPASADSSNAQDAYPTEPLEASWPGAAEFASADDDTQPTGPTVPLGEHGSFNPYAPPNGGQPPAYPPVAQYPAPQDPAPQHPTASHYPASQQYPAPQQYPPAPQPPAAQYPASQQYPASPQYPAPQQYPASPQYPAPQDPTASQYPPAPYPGYPAQPPLVGGSPQPPAQYPGAPGGYPQQPGSPYVAGGYRPAQPAKPSSLSGGRLGAGVGIGAGLIILMFVVNAFGLPLIWPGGLLWLLGIVPVLGTILCFPKPTRSYGVGILIAGAAFWITLIGPCIALFASMGTG